MMRSTTEHGRLAGNHAGPMAAAILAIASATAMADSEPVGSTFTYQGRLVNGGEPVSEPVDLEFRLFDQEAFGNPLSVLAADEFVLGDDGRFTIDLDFGGEAFNGEPRWLEIVVNEVVLAPRQPIMATPHAMVATTATNVPAKAVAGSYFGITGVGTLESLNVSGNVGIGTVNPQANLHIDGSGSNDIGFMMTNPGSASGWIAFGSPLGHTGLSATANNGHRRDLRFMDIGLALTVGDSESSPSSSNGLFISEAGHIGIGTISPLSTMHVKGSQPTLRLDDSANANSYTEILDAAPTQLRINKVNNAGSVFVDVNPMPSVSGDTALVRFFRQTNTSGTKGLRLYRGDNTASLSAVVGVDGADSWFQAHGGNLGIGTTAPAAKLHVVEGGGIGIHGTGAPGVYGEASGSSDYGGLFAGSGAFGSGRSLLVAGDTHMLGFLGVGMTDPTARVDVQTSGSIAVRGVNTSGLYGLFGVSQSATGIGAYGQGRIGHYGFTSTGGFDGKGVYGLSQTSHGVGVHGHASSGSNSAGVYATNSGGGWAAFLEGSTRVEGSLLVTGSKNFIIDNPANPANEYLVHSCVESDEMKNIYDGVVTLDALGEAIVTLPDWFELLNADIRYQLTCVGGYAPVYIAQELSDGSFIIAGDGPRAPGLKVCWQVTGNRIDPAARESNHRVIIPKPEAERGKFLRPAGYGHPESDRVRRMANPRPRSSSIELSDWVDQVRDLLTMYALPLAWNGRQPEQHQQTGDPQHPLEMSR